MALHRNLHRDRMRRKTRHEELDAASSDPKPGPDTTAGDRSELQSVLNAMQKIPEADRAVLVMAAVEQIPYDVIAAALRLSIGAVKVRIHRARLKLGAALQTEKSRK